MLRVSLALVVVLALGACGPNGAISNAADDLENASDGLGNRTNNQMERIGKRIAPVLENTIDRIDGNSVDNASNATGNRAD